MVHYGCQWTNSGLKRGVRSRSSSVFLGLEMSGLACMTRPEGSVEIYSSGPSSSVIISTIGLFCLGSEYQPTKKGKKNKKRSQMSTQS